MACNCGKKRTPEQLAAMRLRNQVKIAKLGIKRMADFAKSKAPFDATASGVVADNVERVAQLTTDIQ